MVLKGIMTIELTDEATGDVETVTEENMITEAVNNILGLNRWGSFMPPPGNTMRQFCGMGAFCHLSQHDRRHPAVLQGPGRRYGTYL